MPLDYFLPNWLASLFNLLFFCWFAWIFVFLLRRTKSWERVYLEIPIGFILLNPIEFLIRQDGLIAFRFVHAAADAVMIIAAILLYRAAPRDIGPPESIEPSS